MRVPYNWLNSYLKLDYDYQELEKVMTMAGLEVDGVEYMGEGLEDIVIGRITEITKHPAADKLVICQVDLGEQVLQIVTGAPNVKEGAMVAVATIGTVLPNGMKIKKAKLRGVESAGMMCSSDELGLSEERASGIMLLGDDAQVGMRLVDYLGLNEYVLKLDLTPNYSRCLGMLGIAREIKGLQGKGKINYPATEIKETAENIQDLVEVEVKDQDLCPRYTGRIIKNVKIGPSPLWMQNRLRAAGIRAINNIVDITNYVLLEYNQPLHAFDYDKIAGSKVIVRRAKPGEKLLTLDDQERELDQEVLVIADAEKAIGLAGVMGGANTEVTADTCNIFLEAAYFDPVNIRKTAKKLALPSEASHRFERGIDIEMVEEASKRACHLMEKYAGGEVVQGIIDIYPEPYQAKEIELETAYVNKILGLELSTAEIAKMLTSLDFTVKPINDARQLVIVPSFRNDVEREADLVEEIARIYGYNNIPVTRPLSKQQGGKNFKQKIEDLSRDLMLSYGLDEVITYSLTGEDRYELLQLPEDSPLRNWVRIKNPLSEPYAILRTSLIPSILEVLSNNAKRQISRMGIFELGNVFFKKGDGEYLQELKLAGGSMGYEGDPWQTGAPNFFYLKGILEAYLQEMGIKDLEFLSSDEPYLHPGRRARLIAKGKELGFLGELLPEIIEEMDLLAGTTVFQLDFAAIMELVNLSKNYQALPKYPAVERDLALLVGQEVRAASLEKTIQKAGGKLLRKLKLFDLYQGDQIPAGKKSLAFKLLFQAQDRTLKDEEVNKIFHKILKALEKENQAEIRS